jgi:predicted 2-oxoglutarate/Fe(II)-dependent dioxygenase YbiX
MYRVNEYLGEIIVRPKIFTPGECKTIYTDLSLRDSGNNVAGEEIYGFANRFQLNLADRKTAWIQQRVTHMVNIVNQMYYRFKLSQVKEIQLLEYNEKCFFDWHIDISSKDPLHSTRKINTVVFLSDPKDYEGGQLTFHLAKAPGLNDIEQEQGTMVFFPSYRAHKVETITKGVRYSLSSIFYGNSFS